MSILRLRQHIARIEMAKLREAAVDHFIAGQTVTAELKTYSDGLRSVLDTAMLDDVPALPEKPLEIQK